MFIQVKHTYELSEGARLFLRALAREFTEVFMANVSEAVLSHVTALNERITALNGVVDRFGTNIEGVTGDIDRIKKELDRIQNSPGPISPGDQQSLDTALTVIDPVITRLTALADALQAADDLTPLPEPPPELPPVEPAPEA